MLAGVSSPVRRKARDGDGAKTVKPRATQRTARPAVSSARSSAAGIGADGQEHRAHAARDPHDHPRREREGRGRRKGGNEHRAGVAGHGPAPAGEHGRPYRRAAASATTPMTRETISARKNGASSGVTSSVMASGPLLH